MLEHVLGEDLGEAVVVEGSGEPAQVVDHVHAVEQGDVQVEPALAHVGAATEVGRARRAAA